MPGTITVSDVIEEQIEDDSKDGKSSIRKINRHQVDLRYGQAGAPHYALAIVGNPPDQSAEPGSLELLPEEGDQNLMQRAIDRSELGVKRGAEAVDRCDNRK